MGEQTGLCILKCTGVSPRREGERLYGTANRLAVHDLSKRFDISSGADDPRL